MANLDQPAAQGEQSNWDKILKALTQPNEKWFGPDTQVGLGQMAKAVNPYGVTGNVGEMFSNYVQGIQAQQATAQQMKQQQEFMTHIYRALGLLPKAEQEAKSELSTGGDSTINLWGSGWDKNYGKDSQAYGGYYNGR